MSTKRTFRLLAAAAGLVVLAALVGCSGSSDAKSPAANPPADSPPAKPEKPLVSTTLPPEGVAPPDRETWEILSIQGTRVGYVHATYRNVTESGRKLVRIEVVTHLAVKRFGELSEQNTRHTGTETPDGKLIEYTAEIQQGTIPMRTSGRVVGDKLVIETTTLGKSISKTIPWPADYLGFTGPEQTLRHRPMRPGERRVIHALEPTLNCAATYDMAARDYEEVELLGGKYHLLRIDTRMQLPNDSTLETVVWSTPAGETMKTLLKAMDIQTIRATKELALEKTDLGELDLGADVTVELDRPLKRPHETRRVRYRVHLEGSDPAKVFVSGASQQVKSIGEETAELTVYALRPGQSGGNPDAADDPPTEDDRQPNNFVQSDDERIVAMARQAAGDETDPWQVALKLERFVHETITEKNFSQAFATAAEVAEDPNGDCSEHAVLLAALARARGIPARVAMGLVYMQGRRAFGYHMWTEVFVEGRWIPLDATLAKGGIGAAHLKLAHSNLKGTSAYTSFLPVIRVIGRLKVEIEEVQ